MRFLKLRWLFLYAFASAATIIALKVNEPVLGRYFCFGSPGLLASKADLVDQMAPLVWSEIKFELRDLSDPKTIIPPPAGAHEKFQKAIELLKLCYKMHPLGTCDYVGPNIKFKNGLERELYPDSRAFVNTSLDFELMITRIDGDDSRSRYRFRIIEPAWTPDSISTCTIRCDCDANYTYND